MREPRERKTETRREFRIPKASQSRPTFNPAETRTTNPNASKSVLRIEEAFPMAGPDRLDMLDSEIDPPLPGRLERLGPKPEYYLRIMANPFLAVAAMILDGLAAAAVFRRQETGAIVLGSACVAIGLFLSPGLLQYHCLDCGETGRLRRWRLHVCPKSTARYLSGRRRRLRGPSPGFQILLWLALFGYLLLVLRVLADV